MRILFPVADFFFTFIGVTQNASAYQDLATSNNNIYEEYTEISYRNG